jgi:hypothetical protein
MNALAQAFAAYHKRVYPDGIPVTQFKETEQAFYAGAFVMFQTMMTATGDLPEDQAHNALNALEAEMAAYHAARHKELAKNQ